MAGKGRDLDQMVKDGDLKEISPEEMTSDHTEKTPPEAPEQPVTEEPATEAPVEQPAQTEEKPELDPEIYAPDGVPWKNKAMQADRQSKKLRELEEENRTLKTPSIRPPVFAPTMSAVTPFTPDDSRPEAEAYWKRREEETGLDRQIIAATEKVAVTAAEEARNRIDAAVRNQEIAIDYVMSILPAAERYRAEISERLGRCSMQARSDINVATGIAKMVLGEHYGEAIAPVKKAVAKPKVASVTTSVAPKVPSIGTKKARIEKLPLDVERWAYEKELFSNGRSNEEIMALFEKFKKIRTPQSSK